MSMRQPEQERVLRPHHRIIQTTLQQRFAALYHLDVFRLLDAEREVWQVPSAKPVFEVRLDGGLFQLLRHAGQTGQHRQRHYRGAAHTGPATAPSIQETWLTACTKVLTPVSIPGCNAKWIISQTAYCTAISTI